MEKFSEIKKNFGFGVMRLPLSEDKKINLEEFKKMVDYFIDSGFNYFDTAHGYLSEQSELALKECLTKRYKRSDYVLTNKLSPNYFSKEEDILPLFEKQLECCGVEYFDFYLMHAQQKNNYDQYNKCHAYEIAKRLKEEGKIHHIGISFHDTAEFLEKILIEHPEIEVVQLQFNYLDYEDENVQSRKCYEVAKKYNKPVIVMEPVKGGKLVNLPKKADEILKNLKNGSNASYAIRFAASFENVFMTLSGMSDMKQLQDNVSFMKDFKSLNEKEMEALKEVVKIFNELPTIPCTNCKYCVDGCPKQILIPDLFNAFNQKVMFKDGESNWRYKRSIENHGKPTDCIKCGKCEKICPQHLPIRELLLKANESFK